MTDRAHEWAATQSNLGNALSRIDERETGNGHLEEAVTAFRAAIMEYTRDREALYWTMAQNNLGNALWKLGKYEGGIKRLE